jgi:dienelactone hydrolase
MTELIKHKISFASGKEQCAGYMHLPRSDKQFPCVIMANGFSGTMDWILPAFAERFVAADIAVCTFDYRHLGESSGHPRQIVDIDKQREDLLNAINFVKRYEGIDPGRIALWGTSLGGSHVVEVAARTPGIKALICNMPAIDAIKGANVKAKIKSLGATRLQLITVTLRLILAAVWDLLRSSLGLLPYYLKVYGQPGKAFFTDPLLAKNFERVAARSASWQNKIAARFLLKPPRYKDGTLERIKAPIFFALAEKDQEVSAAFIREKAAGAGLAEIREYPFGHFELYHGAAFETVVSDQVAFLQKHL